jgi:dTDP-4-amino-4,6-dideoxygalactose transaminase
MSDGRQKNTATRADCSAASQVPLLDLAAQFDGQATEILAAIAQICRSGKFVLGPQVEEFEHAVAAYCGTRHAVACASGSDALLLALMALDIGAGHEVIVPGYTFFATASAVARLGARPVFVDIDPVSFNVPAAAVEAAVTKATRAVIPVHLFGQCADMDGIRDVAARHSLALIEDAAQAIGAQFRGVRAGKLGDMACFSFYPTKNLGAYGDGGLLTTDSDELAARLRLLRVHGMHPRYHHHVVGINSRLDSIQAAVLNVKLRRLEAWTARREHLAARYAREFARAGLDRALSLPAAVVPGRHVWNQYVIRVSGGRRDRLREHLAARCVASEIYYPLGLHMQPCFSYLAQREGTLPETERAARESLALPIYPEMTDSQQDHVVESIREFHHFAPAAAPLAGAAAAPIVEGVPAPAPFAAR